MNPSSRLCLTAGTHSVQRIAYKFTHLSTYYRIGRPPSVMAAGSIRLLFTELYGPFHQSWTRRGRHFVPGFSLSLLPFLEAGAPTTGGGGGESLRVYSTPAVPSSGQWALGKSQQRVAKERLTDAAPARPKRDFILFLRPSLFFNAPTPFKKTARSVSQTYRKSHKQ